MADLHDWKWVAAAVLGVLAAALAWRKTDGWGWFLFIAFVIAVSNP